MIPDHFVKPTHAASIPQSLVFVDCESEAHISPDGKTQVQTFRLGVAISVRRMCGKWERRNVLRFDDTFDFWEWLIPKVSFKQPIWVFAHNLAVDSTWLDVWGRVDDGTLKINDPCPNCLKYKKTDCTKHTPFKGACVVSDPPIILCLKCSRGIIRFNDTMNYWKTSVAKLGRGIGLPKLDNPGPDATQEQLFDYCQRDVEIIERSVCGLLDEWETEQCGHFATTAAGLAWGAFRKTLEPKQILIDHGEPHTSLERESYYGGQAEAYFIGKRDDAITLLDVRSLYPHIMQDQYFPVQFLRMGKDLTIKAVKARLLFDCCIARVIVKTENAGYPRRIKADNTRPMQDGHVALSGKVRWKSDRLGFPVGTYTTAIAGPELLRAIERNEIVEILSIAWYRSAKIFTDFVQTWFAKRPNPVTPATFARDLLCKTVLNSMSGYFAKHKMRWHDRLDLRPLARWGEWFGIDAETGKSTKYRAIGGNVQELEAGGESRDSFPAISAYITSYGREHMLWLREQCPEQSVLYQDTDSLMVTADGLAELSYRGLIGSGELGQLRYINTLNNLTIYGVKNYESDAGRVAAGVKEKAIQTSPGVYLQESWESLAAQWSRGPAGDVRIENVVIRRSKDHIERRESKAGWTLPMRMDGALELPF